MKKILFYLCGIYNGGTEIVTLNLLKNLDKNKYQLLYYYHDKENVYEPIKKQFDVYAEYINIDSRVTVDTLIFCTHALEDLDKLGNIAWNHSYFWFHYFWEDQEEFLKIAIQNHVIEKVITVGEYAKRKLEEMDCVRSVKEDVCIIPNIMNDEKIIEQSKEKINLERAKDLNLVTVARFAPIKGYARVKQMINILLQEQIQFKWYICGKGSNKKEHDEVVEMLQGYEDYVELVGFKMNPYPYMKNADYLVLMSDRETQGLVVAESKIIGTPCIVSNFEAAYEQIEDGKNGFIIDKNNILEFKERLTDIIKQKKQMKMALKEFQYDKEAIMKKWEKIL